MICFKCNHEESEDFSFCPECGSKQTCQCGQALKLNNKFCTGCGAKVGVLLESVIKQPLINNVQLPISNNEVPTYLSKTKNESVFTNDNGNLKKIFNLITTPLFLLTFLLLLIALFVPLYTFTIFEGQNIKELNISIVTYIFVGRQHQFYLLDSFFAFRCGFYIGTTILVITFSILGTIKGIKSFSDGNEKVGEYALSATLAMTIPFFLTRMLVSNVSIFLLTTIVVGFIAIFTRIIFNIILNRKKFIGIHLVSYIMNLSAVIIIVFSLFFLFGKVFDFYVNRLDISMTGGVFGVINIFRQLNEIGNWTNYDIIIDSLIFPAIISLITLFTIVALIELMLKRALRSNTVTNSENIIIISLIMCLVILLWFSGFVGAQAQFNAQTKLNNSLPFGSLLVLLALIISITSSIIFTASKGKIMDYNNVAFNSITQPDNDLKSIENTFSIPQPPTQIVQVNNLQSSLPINDISAIFALTTAGLILLTFFVTLATIFIFSFAIILIVERLPIITTLMVIATLVLHIVCLSQSNKHNISILGHTFSIVGVGSFILGGLLAFTLDLNLLSPLLWFIAFVFMTLGGIFILIAKPKIANYRYNVQ